MVLGRPRKEGPLLSEVLKVRIAQAKADELDEVRGEQSRSDFTRAAINDRITALRGKK